MSLPLALKRAGLDVKDIARFEINEAFSAVIRVIEKIMGLDPKRVNPDGCVLYLLFSTVRRPFFSLFFVMNLCSNLALIGPTRLFLPLILVPPAAPPHYSWTPFYSNSGAVALGHALGSSGSRIVVTLVHGLKSGEFGAAAICNGVCALLPFLPRDLANFDDPLPPPC